MAVFVEAGRSRREWEARKSISGAVRGSPGRAVQAGIRGIELKYTRLIKQTLDRSFCLRFVIDILVAMETVT